LIHSFQRSGKWSHETVDGNGDDVQDYREELRRKTASDVSVSNACASTSQGLQVFYRDESQGILLGAVRTSNGWVYEIVDGDKTSEGRTTGDVAFHLSATIDKNTVYLLYDSVLTINSNRDATSGEVRLAIRKTVFPEDWRYQTLDGPDNGNAVAGYATAISNNKGRVIATWLVSRGDELPHPTFVSYAEVSKTNFRYTITPLEFGNPHTPLAVSRQYIIFGCQKRLCKVTFESHRTSLVSGNTNALGSGIVVKGASKDALFISSNKQLKAIQIQVNPQID
jgi:hypothetical protein